MLLSDIKEELEVEYYELAGSDIETQKIIIKLKLSELNSKLGNTRRTICLW